MAGASPTPPAAPRDRFVDGARAALPFGAAAFGVALSFPVVAAEAGFGPLAAIAASAIVFAGSAQFTAVAILAQGGGPLAAIAAAALMNSRFLPMGMALAPSLPGRALRRAIQGQAVVDASWALAARGDGTFDRWRLFGATALQYPCWVAGTAVGAVIGDRLGDPEALGLDAVFPAFFLALLLGETRTARARIVAVTGAAIAIALTPVAPRGTSRPPRELRRPVGPLAARMSTTVVVILGLTAATVAVKAVGPVTVGGRDLPPWSQRLVLAVGPAVLAALVVTQTFADGSRLTVGPEAIGVAASGVVMWRTTSVVAAIVTAAVVTAALRALF